MAGSCFHRRAEFAPENRPIHISLARSVQSGNAGRDGHKMGRESYSLDACLSALLFCSVAFVSEEPSVSFPPSSVARFWSDLA